jgi:hypothetical protein
MAADIKKKVAPKKKDTHHEDAKKRQYDEDDDKKAHQAKEPAKKDDKGLLGGIGDFLGDNKGGLIGGALMGILGMMVGGPMGAILGLLIGGLLGGKMGGDKNGGLIGGMLGGLGNGGKSPAGKGQARDKGEVFGLTQDGKIVSANSPDAHVKVHGHHVKDKNGAVFHADSVVVNKDGKMIQGQVDIDLPMSGSGKNLRVNANSKKFDELLGEIENGAKVAQQQSSGPPMGMNAVLNHGFGRAGMGGGFGASGFGQGGFGAGVSGGEQVDPGTNVNSQSFGASGVFTGIGKN